VSDLRLSARGPARSSLAAVPSLRWQVSISRKTRTASAGRLFVAQVGAPLGGSGAVEAKGVLTGVLPEEDLLGLLVAGLLLLDNLGHARSRGLGWLGPRAIEVRTAPEGGVPRENMRLIDDPATYAAQQLRSLVQRYGLDVAGAPAIR
jgi:CRISPR/Cas system CSM-associated protein Csm3 (group 7 of RAMP superfamily)